MIAHALAVCIVAVIYAGVIFIVGKIERLP
jgi:hypothetical protein